MSALIHVTAELERCGIPYKFGSEKEVLVKCPFHPDDQPSCSINIKESVFLCQAAECKESGDFVTLLARFLGQSRKVILEDLSTRYDLQLEKVINPETIERYHARIWQAKPLLAELYARGCHDGIIRFHRIGESNNRITLPIRNEFGSFVNVRSYLPGAPGKDKMKNAKGFSKCRLTPIDQLRFDTILICGGELKAWVAADQLNKHGIGAISATAGESNWDSSFTPKFKSKRVIVCLDIDKGGQISANAICLQMRTVADWVGNLILPLDPDKYPKGDINDYLGPLRPDQPQLKPLIDTCPEYAPTVIKEGYNDTTEPIPLELVDSIDAKNTAKRMKVSAVVSMMDTAPYVIPKDIEIQCGRDAKGGICALCPVVIEDRQAFTIPPESPAILELVATGKERQLEVVKSAVGIPMNCGVCQFAAGSWYNVEDVRLSNKLEITQRGTDLLQPAFCIKEGNSIKLDLNESYDMVGRMFPHPKTQQATLLISSYKTSQDALSTYQLEGIDDCAAFWPRDSEGNISWTKEAIAAKLDEIYSDLETNVTQIFQRRDVHLAVDLTYHSLLYFDFDGKRNTKGYMETLILGDTSQGKSEICCGATGSGGLMTHYGLGDVVDSKNASVAGLLGGCTQNGTRWWIKWGAIPKNDRRCCILEEFKGLKVESIAQLTQMRSSGKARLDKIVSRETSARCRLICPSNARGDVKLSTFNYGVQAAKELIGAPEDIRRFDLVMIVDERDVNADVINQLRKNRPQVIHTYSSELCRRLVLWAWTRRGENVFFTEDATALILQTAVELTGMFSETIPIVDKGSMRFKLARMSAALAARLFSCSEDYESVIVDACHVEYIADFIKRTYSAPTFGYLDFTKAQNVSQTLVDAEIIGQFINNTPFALDLCNSLLTAVKIDINDLQDYTGWTREDATHLLSLLVRKHALIRDGKQYRKSAAFIEMLKTMIKNGEVKNRPDHIKVKEF